MLKFIMIGCQCPTALPQLMLDQGMPVAVVSALTMANLATLVISCWRRLATKSSKPTRSINPYEIWQACNVSIALWLLCLIAIGMGAQ